MARLARIAISASALAVSIDSLASSPMANAVPPTAIPASDAAKNPTLPFAESIFPENESTNPPKYVPPKTSVSCPLNPPNDLFIPSVEDLVFLSAASNG